MPRLMPADLLRSCDPASFAFTTTAELSAPAQVPGQTRALEALRMAIRIDGLGYNVFACGPLSAGRREIVEQELTKESRQRRVPGDWCYVHNFQQPDRPLALPLPAGRGAALQAALQKLVQDVP